MTQAFIAPSSQTLEHVLQHVTEDLAAKFADTTTPEHVSDIVRTARAELEPQQEHHIEFLACLIEHRARTILHELAEMEQINPS